MMFSNETFEKHRYKYIYSLAIWISFNSLGPIRRSSIAQIISMFFGFIGILVLLEYLYVKEYEKHPMLLVATSLVFASMISLVGNSFSYLVKNVYSIISLSINFFILFTFYTDRDFKQKVMRISKTLFTIISIVSIVNLLLLLFNIGIPIGNYNHISEASFIGVDLWRGRFTGIQLNPNGLSRYSLAGMISGLFLLNLGSTEIYKKHKISYFLGQMANIMVILLSQSRGSILALSFGCYLYYASKVWKHYFNQKLFYKLSLLALLLVLFAINTFAFNKASHLLVKVYPTFNVVETIEDLEDVETTEGLKDRNEKDKDILESDITNGRFTLIKNGVNATLSKHPIVGLTYGGNTTQVQGYIDQNNIKLPQYLYRTSGSMHNTLIQAYINNGIIGFVSLGIYLLCILVGCIKLMLTKDIFTIDTKLLQFLSFILGVMIVLNLVEWVFYFDFDNHLLNFQNMIFSGFFWSLIKNNKKRGDIHE